MIVLLQTNKYYFNKLCILCSKSLHNWNSWNKLYGL